MLNTTRRGVLYPNPDRSDRDDIAVHIGYIAAAVDVDVLFNQGTDANRLAAAHQASGGRFWWSTDTQLLWWDDGTTWWQVQTPQLSVPNTQVANYTLVLTDSTKTVEMNLAGANIVTIPPNVQTAFPLGTTVNIAQLGAGQTTLTPGSGVTIRSYNNNLRLAGQYAMCSVIKRATDIWWAAGNLVQ